jgi:hypothetical protein
VTWPTPLLLDLAFGDLGLRRVQAACAMDHAAARATLERLGLTYEGRMRGHLRVADDWRDSALYSVLSPEWAAVRAKGTSVTRRRRPADESVGKSGKRGAAEPDVG